MKYLLVNLEQCFKSTINFMKGYGGLLCSGTPNTVKISVPEMLLNVPLHLASS